MKGTSKWAWGMALGLVLGTTALKLEAADSAAVRPAAVQNVAPAEPKAAVADSKSAKAKARLAKLDAEYKARRKTDAQRREARLKEVRKEAKERAEARERAENPPEVKVFVSNEPSPSEKSRK